MVFFSAEREGFEPSIRYERIHAFQACAFNHSAISPIVDSVPGVLEAEGVGFEPTVPVKVQLISNQSPSTTRPPLHETRTSCQRSPANVTGLLPNRVTDWFHRGFLSASPDGVEKLRQNLTAFRVEASRRHFHAVIKPGIFPEGVK
jgi:hypothetical protein